jgi:tetratricopeptide (TPR) repeat protein
LIVSSILAVEVAAIDSRDDEAVSAVVMTVRGETIEGRFIGATGTELTIETPSRRVALRLAEVSYVSFGGRPGAVSHALPNTPSSDLRVQGAVLESAGRLEDARLKYEESAKLDPGDVLTLRALTGVNRRIEARDSVVRAAPYKALTPKLRDAGRYGEAVACYLEAVRLDPRDEKFKEAFKALAHYWKPSSCPTKEQ